MKNELHTARRWIIGIMGETPERPGALSIVATVEALGKSAQHALRRVKKDTKGCNACIMGEAI